ncbi:hypothetical protein L596_024267 [Steinernema carpocapsae]|uniref:Lethal protein 858 n=1 Tax=Steinernema carpocapsae TaxID=34508 RepID=A0A4U5MG91_STECR|nr:hypothetical protein L596_024267 [Steinernema carpocapsae]
MSTPSSPKREEPKKRAAEEPEGAPPAKKDAVDIVRSKAGGAYIPPAKLRMMQEQIGDKNSKQFQRMNWKLIKKKIHGPVNKVNVGNLVSIVRELLQINIIRAKGVLARAIIQAQAFSPTFSHVYAALVAVINSKFPSIGQLLLTRLIVQFKRAFHFNNKIIAITMAKFIAHLVNQQVAHEIIALQILIVLLENPTADSIEVAVSFLKECGAKLTDVSPKGLTSVFDRLRTILSEADIDSRVQYMIEAIFHIRKDKFRAYPALIEDLDLIDEEDQVTHIVSLEESHDPENSLNVFKFDPDFEANEANYDEVRKQVIGSGGETSSEEEDGEQGSGDEDEDEEADQKLAETAQTQTIIDNTEQHMVAFRRKVFLTIQSSLDFQEAAHKLLKNHYKTGLKRELCYMVVDCCAQERTYNRFFGLLAERFCRLKKEFQESFESSFRETYEIIHRFDITKLRNVVRLYSHLLATDAISWTVLSGVKMSEDNMTSAGRVFVKMMFQELTTAWGVAKLLQRISNSTMQEAFEGLFPRDNPKNTRFAINFYTLIGLGGLTVDLREHLKKVKKREMKLLKQRWAQVSHRDA